MLKFVLAAALALVPARAAAVDVSGPLPPHHVLHRELRLADDLGLLDGPLRGQAPLTRAEAFRLLGPLAAGVTRETGLVPIGADARRGLTPAVAARLTAARDGLVPWDLFWEDGVYPTDFGFDPLHRVELSGSDVERGLVAPRYLDHGERRTEGFSLVRDGLVFVEGEGLAFTGLWRLRLDRDAVAYRPIVFSLRTGWRNLRLSAGREPILWGPEAHGGLLLSANARPLDQVRVESEFPFRLPGPLAGAGSWTLASFLGRLDDPDRRDAPDPWLFGARATWAPARWLVVGLARTTMLGGEGHGFVVTPRSLFDLLLARNENRRAGDHRNDTDHRAGVDWSLYLWPVLRPVPLLDGGRLYGTYAGEDSPQEGPLPSAPATTYGIELVARGVLVRAEASNAREDANLWYWHQVYTDGYTYRGRVIGHPMGPDSRAQSYDVEIPIGARMLLTAGMERQEHGFYHPAGGPPGSIPLPVPHAVQDLFHLGVERRFAAGTVRGEIRGLREWGDLERNGPLESWGASLFWRR